VIDGESEGDDCYEVICAEAKTKLKWF